MLVVLVVWHRGERINLALEGAGAQVALQKHFCSLQLFLLAAGADDACSVWDAFRLAGGVVWLCTCG